MRSRVALGVLASIAVFGAEKPTFHKNVDVILQKHCQGCHRPGEAAPFSLLTYKDARPWAKAIRAAVASRKMPPWFADAPHGKFSNDSRLSADEIATVTGWVDAGAPEGDAKDAPPPLQFADDWKIGKPDLVVEIPVDFSVPAQGVVNYVWMASDMGLTEDKWIERIEVRPGDRRVVHHALVFARPPGSDYRKNLQPGGTVDRPEVEPKNRGPQNGRGQFMSGSTAVEMIGDYVPNGDPYVALPGQARFVSAGSHMLFQMHYTTMGKETKDRTRVGIVFAKAPPKERVVNDAVLNNSLRIPPGAPNHEASATVTIKHDTVVGGFGPHMHVRGKAMKYELVRADGTVETLLNVPAYDFNWQLRYQPVEMVAVKKGDQLRMTSWFDNSPNNRYNPDPAKEVFWGDQTTSEMLFGFFDYVVPANVDPSLVTGQGKAALPTTASR